MATDTRRAKRQHAGTAILDQLADLDVRSISPDTAKTLLKLRFDEFHHERFNLLTAKAGEAGLTLSEQEGAIAPLPRISAEFERSGLGTCPEFLSR